VQPKDYVNAILVPEGGQIPLDVENLASKGIFHVVCSSILLATMVLIDGFTENGTMFCMILYTIFLPFAL
jgi:hypothetical protein